MKRASHAYVTLGVALALSAFVCGCKSLMASSASIYGQWVLHEIQSNGNTLNTDAVTFSLALTEAFNLTENTRANGKVACNSWHGQARVDNDRLQLTAAGATRKRCIIENDVLLKIERTYLSTLQRASQYSVSDTQLQLRVENGDTWIFQRKTP